MTEMSLELALETKRKCVLISL